MFARGWRNVALLACGGLLALANAPGAQALEKIKVTVPTASMAFFPLYYGQDKGFFAKEGMDVEVVSTNGDGPDVDAVLSGSVPFAISTPNRLFTSFEQGRALKAIAMVANRMSIECAMNKQVADKLGITATTPFEQKLKALKGLTVAGTRPGAFTYLLLETYIKRAGYMPQKDTKLIGVGGVNSMLPAVENNQIAVGCTGSPFIELAVKRGKAIRFTDNAHGQDPVFDNFLYELVYARPDFLKEHADTARKFLRALFAATNEVLNTPAKSHLAELKARFGGVPDDVLLEAFENTKAILTRDGVITPQSVQKAGEFLVSTGGVKKAATYDQVATNDFLPKH